MAHASSTSCNSEARLHHTIRFEHVDEAYSLDTMEKLALKTVPSLAVLSRVTAKGLLDAL